MVDRQYEKSEVILIVILSVYCVALTFGALAYIFVEYDRLYGQDGLDEAVLFHLVCAVGVLASLMRGASFLYDEVGRGTFDPRSALSVLMRPVEGAALSVVAYFFFRSLLLLLGLEFTEINPWGFLTVAAVAGLFSHRMGDALRDRFSKLFSDSGTPAAPTS